LIRSLAARDVCASRLVWVPCNTAKAARTIEHFLAHDPELCASIKAQLTAPLKDASAVNATRRALYEALADIGLPVEAASGGRTKFNRTCLGIAKTHARDAQLAIKAACGTRGLLPHQPEQERFCGCYTRAKRVRGFQTGDMVRGPRCPRANAPASTSGALACGQGVLSRPYQTNGIMR
jgi:hypothetical protein